MEAFRIITTSAGKFSLHHVLDVARLPAPTCSAHHLRPVDALPAAQAPAQRASRAALARIAATLAAGHASMLIWLAPINRGLFAS
jgi:hypothetical protein